MEVISAALGRRVGVDEGTFPEYSHPFISLSKAFFRDSCVYCSAQFLLFPEIMSLLTAPESLCYCVW